MDTSLVSTLAALAGAIIGGLTTFLASWLTQRAQARASWFVHDALRRQDLYREFIEEAIKCYGDALQHGEADIPGIVRLYSKIDRMRLLSSPEVVATAEVIGHKILDTYLQPNRTFPELREMVISGSIDLLAGFSRACRAELAEMRSQYHM